MVALCYKVICVFNHNKLTLDPLDSKTSLIMDDLEYYLDEFQRNGLDLYLDNHHTREIQVRDLFLYFIEYLSYVYNKTLIGAGN